MLNSRARSARGAGSRRTVAPKSEQIAAAMLSILLMLSLVLGGRSAPGYGTGLGLQVAAVLLAVGSTLLRSEPGSSDGGKGVIWIAAAVVALLLVHLLPLPPSVWPLLPGRELVTDELSALHRSPSWMPISLDPRSTRLSGYALLPALCGIVLALKSRSRAPVALAITLLVGTAASIVLGFAQAIGGPDSAAYLLSDTNRDGAVAMFANPNHFSTLLLIALPFSVAAASSVRNREGRRDARLSWWLAGIAVVTVSVALLVVASTAGAILLGPTALASAFLPSRSERKNAKLAVAGLLFLVTTAAGAVMESARAPDLTTSLGTADLDRRGIAAHSVRILRDFFPVGSGVGTFSKVYPLYEDPNTVTEVYVNHAHNDYLEIGVEAGVAGIILLVCFVAWWLGSTYKAWAYGSVDAHWRRAASIAIGVVLLHSLVDYPARTAAIMVPIAVSSVILAQGVKHSGKAKHLEAASSA